jgi:hypothetical protein
MRPAYVIDAYDGIWIEPSGSFCGSLFVRSRAGSYMNPPSSAIFTPTGLRSLDSLRFWQRWRNVTARCHTGLSSGRPDSFSASSANCTFDMSASGLVPLGS